MRREGGELLLETEPFSRSSCHLNLNGSSSATRALARAPADLCEVLPWPVGLSESGLGLRDFLESKLESPDFLESCLGLRDFFESKFESPDFLESCLGLWDLRDSKFEPLDFRLSCLRGAALEFR